MNFILIVTYPWFTTIENEILDEIFFKIFYILALFVHNFPTNIIATKLFPVKQHQYVLDILSLVIPPEHSQRFSGSH